MRKLIGIAVVFALLSFVGSAYGAVAIDDTDGYVGEVSNIKFEGQDITITGSQATVLCNGHKSGVTANVSTESSLGSAALAYGVIRKVTSDNPTTAANTVGLADGTPGQMVTIQLTTKGTPSWVISKTSFPVTTHSTGWATLTFDTSLDQITLLFVDSTYGWVIIGNSGVTVA